jgi:hypothetical protein
MTDEALPARDAPARTETLRQDALKLATKAKRLRDKATLRAIRFQRPQEPHDRKELIGVNELAANLTRIVRLLRDIAKQRHLTPYFATVIADARERIADAEFALAQKGPPRPRHGAASEWSPDIEGA